LLGLYLVHHPCPKNRNSEPINKSDYILIENEIEIEQLDFLLLNDEIIRYRYSLYPGHQGCRDIGYRYSGKILINEEEHKVKLEDRMPAFVGLYNDEIYLLTKNYIYDDRYYWYKFDDKGDLLYLKFDSIPEDFYFIKFENRLINYQYMIDILEDSFENNFELSFNLLKTYVEDEEYFDFGRVEGISGLDYYLRIAMEKVKGDDKKKRRIIKGN